ncbi:unnamed protein product, partial [marine sediment metagenome]
TSQMFMHPCGIVPANLEAWSWFEICCPPHKISRRPIYRIGRFTDPTTGSISYNVTKFNGRPIDYWEREDLAVKCKKP